MAEDNPVGEAFVKRIAFIIIVLAAACGDSTGPEQGGEVTFSYAGAVAGQFAARGSFHDARSPTAEMAYGLPADSTGRAVFVLAQEAGGAYFTLVVPAVTGTFACADQPMEPDCPLDAALTVLVEPERARQYRSVSGSVTVTSASDERIRGTFAFTLYDERNPFQRLDPVRVTSGSFDVGLVDPSEFCVGGFGCN